MGQVRQIGGLPCTRQRHHLARFGGVALGEDRAAQRAGVDGVQAGQRDRVAGQRLQSVSHAHVVRYAASEHQIGLDGYSTEDVLHTPGRGHVQAGRDVLTGFPASAQGDDLGFGKHHALTADRQLLGGAQRGRAKLRQCQIEQAGRFLQEATRARRALVVHDEPDHLARGRVDLDYFGILAADIDDGARGRVQKMGPQCVARDFSHDLGGNTGESQRYPAVSGAHDEVDLVARGIGLIEQPFQQLVCGFLHEHAGRDLRHMQLALVQECGLGRPRSDVHTDDTGGTDLCHPRGIDDRFDVHASTADRMVVGPSIAAAPS